MDAEKNVVEAARKVITTARVNIAQWICVEEEHMKALRAALSAYDSAPAPSEDRVREAVAAVNDASARWVASVGLPDRGDRDEILANAIRRYVTPAPALPAGTVAVSVESLRKWRAWANGICMNFQTESIVTGLADYIRSEIGALIPPPPHPEPSEEQIAEWAEIADKAVRKQSFQDVYNAQRARLACVESLRAAWEAKGGA